MHSAEVSMPEEEQEEPGKLDKWLQEHTGPKFQNFLMGLAAVMGGMLAIVLFMVLPTAIVGGVNHFVNLGWGKVLLCLLYTSGPHRGAVPPGESGHGGKSCAG